MPCLSPLRVHRLADGSISFRRHERDVVEDIKIPCGKCHFCALDLGRQWSIRAWHESQISGLSSFVTLTYSDDHLPSLGSVVRRDSTLFKKRVRDFQVRQGLPSPRIFGCAEYGETTLRPHYHMALLGVWFSDCVKRGQSKTGLPMFESETLNNLWGMGRCTVQTFNIHAAKYMAKYTLAKFQANQAELGRRLVDPRTGVTGIRAAPFIITPKRPALGIPWLQRFSEDVFSYDTIIGPDGKPTGRVAAYDRWLLSVDPVRFEGIKDARQRAAIAGSQPDELDRLFARAAIMDSASRRFNRAGV